MPELRLEIPGIPPSVGHYNAYRVVTPRGGGKAFVKAYPTEAAKSWKATVAAKAAGRKLRGQTYVVSYLIYMPTARRQDLDNFAKCLLDSLTDAGVIHDDSAVSEIHAYKRIDRNNPRTIIVVRTNQEQMFGGENA